MKVVLLHHYYTSESRCDKNHEIEVKFTENKIWTYLADLNEQAQNRLKLIFRNKEKLKAIMADEQKELFEKHTDCVLSET